MEQEDYSKIYEYESMGKVYSGERACISLTSWKSRINTVSKTLYSILKMCPGFHIVLVLSKDEFPLKEKELPENLMLFVNNKLIELFWIKPNLKSFKKWIFTADKYRNVPIITADDGCVYIHNYAEELYNEWKKNKNVIVSSVKIKKENIYFGGSGSGIIFPPNTIIIEKLNDKIIKTSHDDAYYAILTKNKKWKFLNKTGNGNIYIDTDLEGITKKYKPDNNINYLLTLLC